MDEKKNQVTIDEGRAKGISFARMNEGDIGIIQDDNGFGYAGLTVVRGYNSVIALDGGQEWSVSAEHEVKLLTPGTKVTITVGAEGHDITR